VITRVLGITRATLPFVVLEVLALRPCGVGQIGKVCRLGLGDRRIVVLALMLDTCCYVKVCERLRAVPV